MHPGKKEIALNLITYGLAHAVIDATCAAVVFTLLTMGMVSPGYFVTLAVVYNLIAFGSQPLFGLLFDRLQQPKSSALIGSGITVSALVTAPFQPLLGVVLAGVGNALFHVGGGMICLNLTKHKATAPGIFVAPGAIGLLIGTYIGKSANYNSWPFIILILAFMLIIFITKHPPIDYTTNHNRLSYLELTILLLFLVVGVRSFIGTVMVFPWKSNMHLLILLTSAVALGKALGGVIGDRLGWSKTAVASQIISAPLLAFGSENPILAILGMFLFNMTMPITLVAISNTLPGRPGFSFGITTLALILGVIPTYVYLNEYQDALIMAVIIISSAVLYLGLKLHDKNASSVYSS